MLMRHPLALIFAVVFAVCAFGPAPASSADEIDEASLISAMKECSAALRALPENKDSLKTPAACRKASRDFTVTNGGRELRIDNTWIASDLRDIRCALESECVPCVMSRRVTKKAASEAKKEKAKNSECGGGCEFCDDPVPENKSSKKLLSNLADAIDAAAALRIERPANERAVKDGGAMLKKILAGKEYRRFADDEKKKERKEWPIITRLKKWLEKLLGGDKEPAPPGKGSGLTIRPESVTDTIRTVIAALIILAAAFAAALIIMRFKRTLADEAGGDEEESGEPARAAKQMLSEAESLRRKGEYRLAMRSLFHSFLRLLEQRGLVIYIKNKTNGEYLRELRKKGKQAPGAERLNLLFEEAWYGMKDCGEEDYAEFLEAYEKCAKEI